MKSSKAKVYQLSLLCCALCFLVACEKVNDGNHPSQGMAGVEIVPSASLGASATPASRAAIDGTQIPANTANVLAITAYQKAMPTTNYSANVYFDNAMVNSDATGALSFADSKYYPADGSNLYFYAYSPGTGATYVAGSGSTAPTVSWTITGQEDIMAASVLSGISKSSRESDGVTQSQPQFTFEHKLTRIRFKLVRSSNYSEGISASSIVLTGLRTNAGLDLVSGTLSFTGPTANLSLPMPVGGIEIKDSSTAEATVASIMCEAGLSTLKVKVTAGGYEYADATISTPSGSFLAGYCYLVTLTFDGTRIVPTTSIVPWEDGGSNSGTIR